MTIYNSQSRIKQRRKKALENLHIQALTKPPAKPKLPSRTSNKKLNAELQTKYEEAHKVLLAKFEARAISRNAEIKTLEGRIGRV